jgi:hypothetical protein
MLNLKKAAGRTGETEKFTEWIGGRLIDKVYPVALGDDIQSAGITSGEVRCEDKFNDTAMAHRHGMVYSYPCRHATAQY